MKSFQEVLIKILEDFNKGKRSVQDLEWFSEITDYQLKMSRGIPTKISEALEEVFHYVDGSVLTFLKKNPELNLGVPVSLSKLSRVEKIRPKAVFDVKSAFCQAINLVTKGQLNKIGNSSPVLIFSQIKKRKPEMFVLILYNSSSWDRPQLDIKFFSKEEGKPKGYDWALVLSKAN